MQQLSRPKPPHALARLDREHLARVARACLHRAVRLRLTVVRALPRKAAALDRLEATGRAAALLAGLEAAA